MRHKNKQWFAGAHELEVVAAIMYDMAVEEWDLEQNFSLETRQKVSLRSCVSSGHILVLTGVASPLDVQRR